MREDDSELTDHSDPPRRLTGAASASPWWWALTYAQLWERAGAEEEVGGEQRVERWCSVPNHRGMTLPPWPIARTAIAVTYWTFLYKLLH